MQNQFYAWNVVLVVQATSATLIHRENIVRNSLKWALLKSNLTCLTCLHRKSKHTLFCEHVICNVCLRIFEQSTSRNYRFIIRKCTLYCLDTLIVDLKSLTINVRILSIDESDIRDVVFLTFLELLQQIIDSQLRFQDLFNFALKTSSNKLTHNSFLVLIWDFDLEDFIVFDLFDCE